MASIKVQPKNYSMVTTNKFLGMNVENELQLNPGEFTDMENFRITEDYRMEKRRGFERVDITDETFNTLITKKHSYVQLKNDDKPYLYVQGYTNIINNNHYKAAMLKIDMDEKTITPIMTAVTVKEKREWLSYVFNGELYAYVPYFRWTPTQGYYEWKLEKSGGGNFVSVSPTVPTLFYKAKPNGSDFIQRIYQPVNLLTGFRKINYKADGTAKYVLEGAGAWIGIRAYINGVETTAFTYSNTGAPTVTFNTAPASEAEVEIQYNQLTWEYFISAPVFTCTSSMWYGGQNDMDLFVWGNPDYPSTVYHSYAGDPLFFADVGFRTFGDETITDVVVQNTTQLVFGEKSIFRTVIKTNESVANLIEYDAELIIRSKGHKKWTPNTNVQIIDNRPVFISEDGTINELVIISDRDERNVRQLSGRDMSSVLRSTDAVTRVITSTFDFEPKKEYWILFDETTQGETTHKALIYNYGNDTWYKYSGLFDCVTPLLINYQMYMFGDVFSRMNDDLFADIDGGGINHAISAYATTPFLSFNKDFLYKSVQKMFISLSNNFEKDSYVKVEYWTSEEPRRQSINCYLRAGEPPRTESKVIGASRFMFMKFSFISDRVDNACTLINYSVKLHYAGEVRT